MCLPVGRYGCRYCGSLVCKKCSEHNIKVEESLFSGNADANNEQDDVEKLMRCCNSCFDGMYEICNTYLHIYIHTYIHTYIYIYTYDTCGNVITIQM